MFEYSRSGSSVSAHERMLTGSLDDIRDESSQSENEFESRCTDEETNSIFLPSQKRINHMCLAFQYGWSDGELSKRSHLHPVPWRVDEDSGRSELENPFRIQLTGRHRFYDVTLHYGIVSHGNVA